MAILWIKSDLALLHGKRSFCRQMADFFILIKHVLSTIPLFHDVGSSLGGYIRNLKNLRQFFLGSLRYRTQTSLGFLGKDLLPY